MMTFHTSCINKVAVQYAATFTKKIIMKRYIIANKELPAVGSKIYISGAISNVSKYVSDAKFGAAEQWCIERGYIPINPNNMPCNLSHWEEFMKRDIKLLVDCDVILMLDNWKVSRGARLEYDIATRLGMEVLEVINCK